MKTRYRLITLVGAPALLSGCFMGELANRGTLTPPTPYLLKWEKPGISAEGRRKESRGCGSDMLDSSINPDGIAFSQARIEANRQTGESAEAVYGKLFDEWQRCMLKKGYRYTGECYVKGRSPACGAL